MKPLASRAAVLAIACSTLAGLTAISGETASAASTAPAFPPLNPAALEAAIQTQPTDNAAGDIVRVGEPGALWTGSTLDAETGRQIPPDAHFHAGSIAKTFETVVILQLAAEGRIDLDQSIQHYMPGLLPCTFAPITVRQLITFTSGLPDVDEGAPPASADQVIATRYTYRTFDQIIQETLRPTGRPWPGPHFAPGTKQEYNSLGFRIGGALVEQITGHAYKQELTARVLRPLHLTRTSVPENDPVMPRPYLHGYMTDDEGQPIDVSEQGGDPSNLISTPADLDHFITALMQGRLLPPAQQNELFAIPTDSAGQPLPFVNGSSCPKAACFGAGLMSTKLPNGVVLWGKTGHDDGYANGMFATRDLSIRAVYSVSNLSVDFSAPSPLSQRLIEAVLAPAD
ncbi:serine hydrolase domain-containing protein [Catenulispora rubra]|uniref:serine hydrolase domain-containing protein n=1 Tax=Catenulispora rubra TaxID=280293 RepID=UPI0018920700|nr:serine hydrolase domain-containing protein [Catenulispora rubra]